MIIFKKYKIHSSIMQAIEIAGINGTPQVKIILIKPHHSKMFFKTLFYRIFKDLLINVNYNGTVTCTPTVIISVACKTNVKDFPYDEKNCTLTFGR